MTDKPITTGNELQVDQLPTWHKPDIMRLELKRTLFGVGSLIDCSFQAASNTATCP